MSAKRGRALLIVIMVLGASCFFLIEMNSESNVESEVPMMDSVKTDSLKVDTLIINDSNKISK